MNKLRLLQSGIIISVFMLAVSPAYSDTRSEKNAVEKIEELILKSDYSSAMSRCDSFLKSYKTSRFKNRVTFLKGIAESKYYGLKEERIVMTPVPVSGDAPVSAVKSGLYIVQAGAFKNYSKANTLAKTIRKKGFDATVTKVKSGGETSYKVRCGKFKDIQNAERMVRNLSYKGITAKIINE